MSLFLRFCCFISFHKETQMIKIQSSLFGQFLSAFEERLFVSLQMWLFLDKLLNFNDFSTISLCIGASEVVGVFEPWWPLGSLHCFTSCCCSDGELRAWSGLKVPRLKASIQWVDWHWSCFYPPDALHCTTLNWRIPWNSWALNWQKFCLLSILIHMMISKSNWCVREIEKPV